MRIGEISKLTNTETQTIRYYEKIGLLEKPERSDSNYRFYNDSSVKQLIFVNRAKEIGFSLNDIKILLNISNGKIKQCDKVREFAETRLSKIKTQINHLKAVKNILSDLVQRCHLGGQIDECPILDSLTQEIGKGV